MDKNYSKSTFYVDALGVWYKDGTFKISNGDMIVMDNCVFHHGRNTEP